MGCETPAIRRFGFPSGPARDSCGSVWEKGEVELEWRYDQCREKPPTSRQIRLIDMTDPASQAERKRW